MAAHRMTQAGWMDTPMHPLLGVSLFVLGSVALIAVAVVAALSVLL